MQADLLLLVHGEVTDPSVDFFDREKVFIEQKLKPIMEQVPELRIVMEHITTKDAADFVREGPHNLAASITPQHMLLNRNALFLVRTADNVSIRNTCSSNYSCRDVHCKHQTYVAEDFVHWLKLGTTSHHYADVLACALATA